ncbi:glycosyltransferase family 2 protein [Salipiger sp. 1_MG-2023]|uniref:glycosyltransferase family 2 protein n=1 Tax=Salipiger sp. 1_MG-2023 TaxID=3062665 RepID=UPI0026E1FEC5|nr:glycosyltransferase family 2 protein [Salipiger sp. 1_MG-2023]MDO6587037.1 glycosyltransferase family 2 protein [Salipiger sp. 1_MG-2023]
MTEPRVSVLIAAWSAETTLMRAIDSALAQTLPVEVIVIDDASPDRTATLAEARAATDPRLRVLRQTRNQGPAAARNRGLEIAHGEWVTVLDSDDFFCEPDRLARLVALAEAEGAQFVADDLWKLQDGALDGPRCRMISDQPLGAVSLDAAGFVAGNLSSWHGGRREYGFLKPLMQRRFLREHGLSYAPDIRLGEDYVLYTQALIAGARFVLTDPMGYAAVVRSGSLSGWHPSEAHERLIAADRALLALPGVDAPTRKALSAHLMEQRKKWAWRQLIDAKKAADPAAALRCFLAPPPVLADLLGKLGKEVASRLGRRLGLR